MKRILSVIVSVCLLVSLFPLGATKVNAETTEINSAAFTYTVAGGEVEITDCNTDICGDIVIPSILEGYPVTSIGDWAFDNCNLLTSVTIPDGVTIIGNCVFEGCSSLTKIEVSSNNDIYCDIDGVLFDKDKTRLICCPGGRSGEYNIPEGVVGIAISAFAYCSLLTSVTIPDSVKYIEWMAFKDCVSLTNITIPEGVTIIEGSVFEGCSSLTKIEVSSNNDIYCDIDGVLFDKDKTRLICCPGGRSGEYNIPKGVIEIDISAFACCSLLTSVTIPDSVTYIEDYVFEGCSSLVSVIIPSSITNIGYCAFAYCSSLIFETIPNSVTNIEGGAFQGCSSLVSVTIPDSVTDIGECIFRQCTSLVSVTVGNGVTCISSEMFSGCESLANIVIPDSVKYIDSYAFAYCSSLASIIIPSGVVTIGYRAFQSCSSLTSITMFDGVSNIEGSAFEGCSSLASVKIPEGVETLEKSVFRECISLSSIEIPDSVTTIDSNAFAWGKLKVIYIPNSNVLINKNAFYNTDIDYVYYGGDEESRDNLDIESGNDSLKNAIWVYEQTGLPNHEYDNDCDNICNLCKEIRIAPNHIDGHICSNTDCNYTRIVTKADLQTILDAIPDSIQLDIPELECRQADEIICSKIKEVLEKQNYRYEVNGTSIDLKAITMDECHVEIDVNGVAPVEWIDIYSTSIHINLVRANEYDYSAIHKGISLQYSNSHERNQEDEAYIKSLMISSPGLQEIDIDKLINGYSLFDCIKEYYSKQIKDASLTLEINEGVRGCHEWTINDITSANIAIFKNKLLYDIKSTHGEFSVPVINVPCEILDEDTYDYVVGKITELDEDFGKNITSIEKVDTILGEGVIGGYVVTSDEQTGYVIIRKHRKHKYGNNHICNICGKHASARKHTWNSECITKQAGYKKTGTKTYTCTVCGETKTEQIPGISSMILSATAYTYTGNRKTPSVTVKDSKGKKLVKGTDYKLTYSSASPKTIGRYSVKITFVGKYTGSKILYFTIGPKNPTSVKANLYGYDDVKVTWTRVSGASGYRVCYKKSTSSTWSYKTTTGTTTKLSNLADGKKYDVKVVAYKTTGRYRCYNGGKSTSIYTLKKIVGVTAKKTGKKVKVSWTNISGETGYQISQSTRKSGTNIVAAYETTFGRYKTVFATKGKTYYYKVRAYKVVKGKRIYSPWSTTVKYFRK